MWSYYELLTDISHDEVLAYQKMVESGELHPRDAKVELATRIVDDFYTPGSGCISVSTPAPLTIGTSTAAEFNRVFRDGQPPTEMLEIPLIRVPGGLMSSRQVSANVVEQITIPLPSGLIKWSKLLADLGLVSSASEAERVMKQGGFEINGQQVGDPASKLNVDITGSHEVRFGKKKFMRFVVQ